MRRTTDADFNDQHVPVLDRLRAELPRRPTGTLYGRPLRDRYWKRHASRIM